MGHACCVGLEMTSLRGVGLLEACECIVLRVIGELVAESAASNPLSVDALNTQPALAVGVVGVSRQALLPFCERSQHQWTSSIFVPVVVVANILQPAAAT